MPHQQTRTTDMWLDCPHQQQDLWIDSRGQESIGCSFWSCTSSAVVHKPGPWERACNWVQQMNRQGSVFLGDDLSKLMCDAKSSDNTVDTDETASDHNYEESDDDDDDDSLAYSLGNEESMEIEDHTDALRQWRARKRYGTVEHPTWFLSVHTDGGRLRFDLQQESVIFTLYDDEILFVLDGIIQDSPENHFAICVNDCTFLQVDANHILVYLQDMLSERSADPVDGSLQGWHNQHFYAHQGQHYTQGYIFEKNVAV
jgi:hypothetical protein